MTVKWDVGIPSCGLTMLYFQHLNFVFIADAIDQSPNYNKKIMTGLQNDMTRKQLKISVNFKILQEFFCAKHCARYYQGRKAKA